MSTVINLYGGPGTGKSTSAALMFAMLKQAGHNAELVQEYAKTWAWEERPIGVFDQMYFFGKQVRRESFLYERADVIITDSPVALSAFYAKPLKENIGPALRAAVLAYYREAKARGHGHHHVILQRTKPYNPKGRYQTEAEAKRMDSAQQDFLWYLLAEIEPTQEPYYCGTDESDLRSLLGDLGLNPKAT